MERETGELLVDEIISQECKEIKNRLLLALIISLAIVKGGLLPKSISALGISLSIDNTRNLVILLILMCVYFLLSFIQKAISDFIKWKMNFYAAISSEFKKKGMITGEEANGRLNVPGHNDKIDSFMKLVKINNIIRIVFEVGLTVLFTIVSIILILIEINKLAN